MTVCLAGCGKIKDISITSCDIVSISPSGLRSLNGVFLVGIHNPVFKFAVSDIQGTVYHKGTALRCRKSLTTSTAFRELRN